MPSDDLDGTTPSPGDEPDAEPGADQASARGFDRAQEAMPRAEPALPTEAGGASGPGELDAGGETSVTDAAAEPAETAEPASPVPAGEDRRLAHRDVATRPVPIVRIEADHERDDGAPSMPDGPSDQPTHLASASADEGVEPVSRPVTPPASSSEPGPTTSASPAPGTADRATTRAAASAAIGDPAVAAEGPRQTRSDRRTPRKPHRSGRQRAVLVVGVLAALCLVVVAGGIIYVTKRLDSIERQEIPVDAAADSDPINILVVGSDSRENVAKNDPDAGAFIAGIGADAGKRSDTIMIVRINPKTEIIDMLSLPRDLWMPIAGSTENQRINTAYSDSPQKLIDTIRQFFGIEINHYVEVDFKGFKGIVDAVGGVPMYFDKPMRDDNSGLRIDKPGCTVLNGEQALAFARSRHLQYKDDKTGWKDDVTGDIGRIDRQQFFVRQIFDVARKRALSPDLRVANGLLDAIVPNVKVDSKMDVGRMADIGRRFAEKSSDQIKAWSLPVTQYTTAGGASVVRLAADDATPILDVFRGLTPDAWPPSAIKLTVVGSAGQPGQAIKAQQELKNIGFTVAGASDGKQLVKRTTVKHPVGYHRMAIEVARFLANGADVVEDKTISDFTLVLSLGPDFTSTVPEARPIEQATQLPASMTSLPAAAGKNGKATTTTSSSSTTSSTEFVLGGEKAVGVVPGRAPDGVVCTQ